MHSFQICRAKLEIEYGEVKERVFSKYPEKFPESKFTVELFLWAFVMLVSTKKSCCCLAYVLLGEIISALSQRRVRL